MAMTMACVVIFTTMSFTVDMHYCGDTLIDIAVFKEAKSCGMGMAIENSSSSEMKKKSCCHDEQIIVEGQDELRTSFHKLDIQQQDFVAALYASYIHLFDDIETHSISFNGYPPPDIVTDFIVLHEQFLICFLMLYSSQFSITRVHIRTS
jgi:hypothetical protein